MSNELRESLRPVNREDLTRVIRQNPGIVKVAEVLGSVTVTNSHGSHKLGTDDLGRYADVYDSMYRIETEALAGQNV